MFIRAGIVSERRPAHRKDWACGAPHHLLRRRSKQRESNAAPALRTHDNKVSGYRLGGLKDLTMRASQNDHVVDLDPCPRLFGHQEP